MFLISKGMKGCQIRFFVNLNVAKAGALQGQGAAGVAVIIYCDPLITPEIWSPPAFSQGYATLG
jgi:hypothetical protein